MLNYVQKDLLFEWMINHNDKIDVNIYFLECLLSRILKEYLNNGDMNKYIDSTYYYIYIIEKYDATILESKFKNIRFSYSKLLYEKFKMNLGKYIDNLIGKKGRI